ncbi:MAG TPA: tetratricopeptide repeat protein [Peptococcaceae bacterium]|nr:tetratricopeptide repeat protein [Peptococcaceae bacterium]
MNVSFNKWQQHLETGIKYLSEGNYVGAEEQLQASLKEAEALQVPVIIAFSQRLLATAQVKNNKLREAEFGFRRALNYCRQLNNEKGIAEAQAGLASICFMQGNYWQAVNLYQQAINIYPQNSSSLRLAVLYSDLGQVYLRLREWKEAEKAFLKAGDLCSSNGYAKGEAEINLYLGEIQYSQGKNRAAQERFIQAAKIFGLLGDELSLACTHQYLAFILLESNRIEEALQYQYRVIALHLKLRQYSEISEDYYLLSYILQHAKLLDEAEESLKLSLKYFHGHEYGYAVRYHSLAVIAIMKKDYEEAKKYYFEALRYFQFHGDGSKIGEISEELTYLIKYKDACLKQNLSKWLQGRYFNINMPLYEVMLNLANRLKNKGNKMVALRCGWKALELAKVMKGETKEIESLIQDLSAAIRKKK